MYIDISDALSAIHKRIADYRILSTPESLYAPRNYIMDMDGKKMRALLTLLGYGLYRDDWQEALDMAFCAELFHNFTLVHDDIMDDADVRRGQPAVHVQYDEPTAILSGDVMLIEVYDRLAQMEDGITFISLFNKMAREVCEGQAMDMEFETRDDVTIPEYLRMIELKTAVLLGMSLQAGAMLAGAPQIECDHLYHFGVSAGVAFQLQDDYLDVFGDPEKFGKKVGGDIIQGKKTYLYLRAMNLLEGDDRIDFHTAYIDTTLDERAKVSKITKTLSDLYMQNYCEEAQQSYMQLADSHLAMIQTASDDRVEGLRSFIRSLIDRQR